MIEVADNGPGIPPDAMAKIFEPFFTTKPVGEGTGLGLAMVYGVVKQADGWIHVDSAPGKGAAFRIFLPVYVPPAADASAPAKPAKAKPAARDLSGAGRILFVEDEDVVRGVAARLLRARGPGDVHLRLCGGGILRPAGGGDRRDLPGQAPGHQGAGGTGQAAASGGLTLPIAVTTGRERPSRSTF